MAARDARDALDGNPGHRLERSLAVGAPAIRMGEGLLCGYGFYRNFLYINIKQSSSVDSTFHRQACSGVPGRGSHVPTVTLT